MSTPDSRLTSVAALSQKSSVAQEKLRALRLERKLNPGWHAEAKQEELVWTSRTKETCKDQEAAESLQEREHPLFQSRLVTMENVCLLGT